MASSSKAAEALEKAMRENLVGKNSNLPEWTKSESTNTESLTLPEKKPSRMLGSPVETPCLLCDNSYLVPENQNELLKHLLEEHKLVISNVNLVADLFEYVRYYKNKFLRVDYQTFCEKMEVEEKGKKEKVGTRMAFYLLLDVSQEDRALREQLQFRRLEDVLNFQEQERRGEGFKRGCLFCRTVFETWYGDLLDHMAKTHNFSVGHPNNLVFANELLDLLESKLESQVCVYCEKTFKTREVLKEHMRKKGHKMINPHAKVYDRFYLVNYREFGKNWEVLSKERDTFEDEDLPNGFNLDDEDDNDWEGWRGDPSYPVCLFCPAQEEDMTNLNTHMTSIHDFDFIHLRNELKLDFYQQVKLVNFIRRRISLKECMFCKEKLGDREAVVEHMTKEDHFRVPGDWDQLDAELLYFCTYENDFLLHHLSEDGKNEERVPSEVVPEDMSEEEKRAMEFIQMRARQIRTGVP